MEKLYHQRTIRQRLRLLRAQCRSGRLTVKNIQNESKAQVAYIMTKNKELQRLYHNMNLLQVVDSINNRTFKLRKERDRLTERLNRLKDTCLESKVSEIVK